MNENERAVISMRAKIHLKNDIQKILLTQILTQYSKEYLDDAFKILDKLSKS